MAGNDEVLELEAQLVLSSRTELETLERLRMMGDEVDDAQRTEARRTKIMGDEKAKIEQLEAESESERAKNARLEAELRQTDDLYWREGCGGHLAR